MNETSRPATTTAAKPPTPPPPLARTQSAVAPQAAQTQTAQRKIRIELDVPKARSVFVGGTFNNWSPTATPLVFIGGTKWSKDLSLAAGRYEYRFVVDGKWVEPPHAKAYVPNPHGGRNAVFEV